MTHGICNSLFTAQMPVAGSAKITSSYEMTEPITSNLFSRRVTGGEFTISNPYLIYDLEDIGIWSEDLKNEILINNGSIQISATATDAAGCSLQQRRQAFQPPLKATRLRKQAQAAFAIKRQHKADILMGHGLTLDLFADRHVFRTVGFHELQARRGGVK